MVSFCNYGSYLVKGVAFLSVPSGSFYKMHICVNWRSIEQKVIVKSFSPVHLFSHSSGLLSKMSLNVHISQG